MRPVLLLVDLQQDYLTARGLSPTACEVVEATTHLLAAFRAATWPVVHAWTTLRETPPDRRMAHWRRADDRRCREATTGHAPPPSLLPSPGEEIVHKTGYSAFSGTGLGLLLERLAPSPLVIAGVHLHGCVRASLLDAYQLGHEVWVAADAVATDDPLHGDVTRRYLEARAATFLPVAGLLARLSSGSVADPVGLAASLPAALVGGREIPGEGLAALAAVSPRRPAQALWRIPVAGAAEVADAVAAAGEAAAGWRAAPAEQRAALLERLAARVEAAGEWLAVRMAEEIGKPVHYGRAEVTFAADLVREAARRAGSWRYAGLEGGAGWRRVPLGTVALITPWNNPVAVALGKAAPALAFGNAVVWKPAPEGSAIALEIGRWLAEEDAPPGLLNLVLGDRATAESLMRHPGIDGISLTGSEAAGVTAQSLAAARGVPLQAELGGNNAAIVWSDADLGTTATAVAEGAFGAAGQRCTATRRVIVDEGCFETFLDELARATAALPWGDPLAPQTVVGPVISETARRRLDAVVDCAREAGCRVLRPHPATAGDGLDPACRFPPSLVVDPDPGHPIVQEETFGPILVVQRAADFSHAMTLLDGVRQGLVASLFSPDPAHRERFLATARAGILKLDAATAGVAPDLPFCGWKRSGVGPPEHGDGDLEAYTRVQAIYR